MSGAPTLWPQLMDVPFRQRFVTAGGIRTRVVEAGEGPPLVLLHGTGGHAEAYLRNIGTLGRDFHVIAYDMVGHGFTDKPDRPYTLDVYVDHLLALLDVLGVARAHLSGESLGGWVAAWFAQAHPDRVDRLVLTTPGNVTSKPETMKVIRESTMRAVAEASPETVRARLEWLFAPATRHLVSDELVAVRLAIYTLPGAQRAMENILVLQDPEIRARYGWDAEWTGRIAAATLIIWTSDDPTGDYPEGQLLASWIPGAELVLVEDAGHWPQWERPEEFDRLHRAFLGAGPGADVETRARGAIVTGASRGIGLAIAQALGEDGFGVTLVARQPDALRESTERLRAAGLAVQDVAGNLADSATLREAVDRHRETFGRLDLLVNSAGMGAYGPVESLSDRHLDLQLDVNLRAIVVAYREATGLLREAAREHHNALVINLASITAYRPEPGLSVYATTKAAVVALSNAMNQELGPEGIKSTALCPGLVDTDMTAAGDHPVARQDMLATSDIVSAVRWLVSMSPRCVVPELPLTRPGNVT